MTAEGRADSHLEIAHVCLRLFQSRNRSDEDGATDRKAVSQTANYGVPIWKHLLNGTSITVGCNNVFGQDPPDASTTTNYADFLYDSTGRFVYVSLRKKF